MRILLLAQFFPPDIGGEERHVFNLANLLATRGHHVAVATQQLRETSANEVLATGVRVYRFKTTAMRLPGIHSTSRPHHLPFPDPEGALHLGKIVRAEKPDIIHAHNWIVNSALTLRRTSANRPHFGLVLTLHDYSHVCATKRLMRNGSVCIGPSARRCLPCASNHYGLGVGTLTTAATAAMQPWKHKAIDHTISVSRAVAHGNRVPAGPNSSIIPNFVPDSLLVPSSSAVEGAANPALPPRPFLLFVGDLSRDKGVQTLLDAYQRMGRYRPPLLLIGRPTLETPAELPTGAVMRYNWPHAHIMTAFQRCAMAVLPSIWPDPCPTTVLEAMASSVAVVTTSIGGMIDMIDDQENGLLVPPGDDRALATAMLRLLEDNKLATKLKTGAVMKVRAFTASAVVDRLEAVYESVTTPD